MSKHYGSQSAGNKLNNLCPNIMEVRVPASSSTTCVQTLWKSECRQQAQQLVSKHDGRSQSAGNKLNNLCPNMMEVRVPASSSTTCVQTYGSQSAGVKLNNKHDGSQSYGSQSAGNKLNNLCPNIMEVRVPASSSTTCVQTLWKSECRQQAQQLVSKHDGRSQSAGNKLNNLCPNMMEVRVPASSSTTCVQTLWKSECRRQAQQLVSKHYGSQSASVKLNNLCPNIMEVRVPATSSTTCVQT